MFCFRRLSYKTGVLVYTGGGSIFWGVSEGGSANLCGQIGWVGGEKYLASSYRYRVVFQNVNTNNKNNENNKMI